MASVDLTYKCTEGCWYCNRSAKVSFVAPYTSSEIISLLPLISELESPNVPKFHFQGGEPTLFDGWQSVIQGASEIAHTNSSFSLKESWLNLMEVEQSTANMGALFSPLVEVITRNVSAATTLQYLFEQKHLDAVCISLGTPKTLKRYAERWLDTAESWYESSKPSYLCAFFAIDPMEESGEVERTVKYLVTSYPAHTVVLFALEPLGKASRRLGTNCQIDSLKKLAHALKTAKASLDSPHCLRKNVIIMLPRNASLANVPWAIEYAEGLRLERGFLKTVEGKCVKCSIQSPPTRIAVDPFGRVYGCCLAMCGACEMYFGKLEIMSNGIPTYIPVHNTCGGH